MTADPTTADPTKADIDALVIFGATGDLAKLETFPALVGLVDRGVLDVPVIGVAKSGWRLDAFREYAVESLRRNDIKPDSPAAAKMLSLLDYVDGDLTDAATYQALAAKLPAGDRTLFYLEVPPPLFGPIAHGIAQAGLARDARVMVEKPFGHDLPSAQKLNATMRAVFPEDAIYRVDHWLGLDPVENVFTTRFANNILEPVLNRDYVESVQITMAEAFDVADRGRFYDRTGAIRDVLQNHLLQVLSAVLMEPPPSTGLAHLREAKAQIIQSLRPLTPADVVRGQYDGYRQVPGVAPDSTVETFVAVRLSADLWRWAGVPLLIRAGKCLPVTASEIMIRFRKPPLNLFRVAAPEVRNTLRFRIWPQTEVGLTLTGKAPGAQALPQMDELAFIGEPGADMRPYDRLIGAAISGHNWLFSRQDSVEAAWRIVDPVLGDAVPVHDYPRGSWGPAQAAAVLPEGDRWHDPHA